MEEIIGEMYYSSCKHDVPMLAKGKSIKIKVITPRTKEKLTKNDVRWFGAMATLYENLDTVDPFSGNEQINESKRINKVSNPNRLGSKDHGE